MDVVFDPKPGCRPEAEWRRMLGGLVASLSAHTGIRFAPTSWFIEDRPGHASAGGYVDIRGPVSPAFRLEACGVVRISVKHGEAAWASANVQLFSGGRRVLGPDGRGVVHFRYTPDGWWDVGWVNGECGEWEQCQYPTDAQWLAGSAPDAVPGAAADGGA